MALDLLDINNDVYKYEAGEGGLNFAPSYQIKRMTLREYEGGHSGRE